MINNFMAIWFLMFVLSQANRLLPLMFYLAYRHESGIELASYDVILLYIYILFGTTEAGVEQDVGKCKDRPRVNLT